MKRILTTTLFVLNACGGAPADIDSNVAADVATDEADGKADTIGSSESCTLGSRTPAVNVWITPQAGEEPMAAIVSKAKSNVRVMVYMLEAGLIYDALKERAQAGIKEQIILDKSEETANTPAFKELTALGADVIWSDPQFSFMHAKFLVVDGKDAVVATGNFSASLTADERNIFAHDADPKDVGDLVALFDADFARKSPTAIPCTRLIVSPLNSLDSLVALINRAKKSIAIESMQFADADIRNAVVARHNAGVSVRVLLADPTWISTNAAAATFLSTNNIEARRMVAPKVHIKNIIIDGTTTYMGSENLSATSLTMNREVGLILSNKGAVTPIAKSFEADWATATAF